MSEADNFFSWSLAINIYHYLCFSECESEPDTALFILKEGDSTARHLISFIDHRDENVIFFFFFGKT